MIRSKPLSSHKRSSLYHPILVIIEQFIKYRIQLKFVLFTSRIIQRLPAEFKFSAAGELLADSLGIAPILFNTDVRVLSVISITQLVNFHYLFM